jgi:hypothetical protein
VRVTARPACPLRRRAVRSAPGIDIALASCARQAVWAPGGRAFAEHVAGLLAITSRRGLLLATLCNASVASRGGLAWSDSPVLAAIARGGARRSLACRRRGGGGKGDEGESATSQSRYCWRTKRGKKRCVLV